MNQFVKKAAVVAAFVIALPAMNSFATSIHSVADDGGTEIKATLARDFRNAELMSTESRDTYTKVVFKLNQQVMTAYYSNSGELMAVSRNIVTSQLPVNLLLSFRKHYGECWVTDLFEINQNDQTSYYMTLENADGRVVLRSNGDGWSVYSNVKK